MIDIKNIALNTGCNIQQIVGVNPPDYRYGFNSNAQLQAFADEYAALLYSEPIACMYVNDDDDMNNDTDELEKALRDRLIEIYEIDKAELATYVSLVEERVYAIGLKRGKSEMIAIAKHMKKANDENDQKEWLALHDKIYKLAEA